MMINRSTLLLVLLLVCAISCVEHRLFFQIHPDGNTYARFESAGDSLDIHDQDFIHPNLIGWATRKESYQTDDETNWRWVSEGMIRDTLIGLIPFELPQLGYQVNQSLETNLISKTYSFTLELQGRQVKKDYPKLYEAIVSDKTDSLYWLPEALAMLLTKSLNDIYGDSLSHKQSLANQRLVNHLNNSFARMTTLDDLNKIQNNRLSFFKSLVAPLNIDSTLAQKITDSMAIHENVLTKTIDLNDDYFHIKFLLPGVISTTNAMEISNDTLVWKFGLDSLLADNYTLSATSVVYHVDPVKIVLIFAGIFILIFIGYKIKH